MSCEKTVKEILPYIESRLGKERRAGIEKHLTTCASCQLRTDEFRAVTELLNELPVIEPSPAFDIRVHALVAGEPVKRSWLPNLNLWPRVVLGAPALFLAALCSGVYERPRIPAVPWSDPQIADEQMMQDLPVLEDHDLLSNFEPLKELPSSPPRDNGSEGRLMTGQEEGGNEP